MTIQIEALRQSLCAAFCQNITAEAIDDHTATVALPMVGRDGDHVVAYVRETTGGWRISDMGATMMRLSYENDLTKLLTGARERLYATILAESGLSEDDGDIFLEVPGDALIAGLFTLGQGVTRIEDLGLWTRSRIESAFYEDLRAVIAEVVPADQVVEGYVVPGLPNGESYPVDYCVKTPGRPLYVFGIINKEKAMLSTIILQHLAQHGNNFDSMVVYADIDEIPKAHAKRLMNAANDTVASIRDLDVIRKKIRHRIVA